MEQKRKSKKETRERKENWKRTHMKNNKIKAETHTTTAAAQWLFVFVVFFFSLFNTAMKIRFLRQKFGKYEQLASKTRKHSMNKLGVRIWAFHCRWSPDRRRFSVQKLSTTKHMCACVSMFACTLYISFGEKEKNKERD